MPHEIEIRKSGYAGYRKTVTPQPGLVQEIKVRLLTLEEGPLRAPEAAHRHGPRPGTAAHETHPDPARGIAPGTRPPRQRGAARRRPDPVLLHRREGGQQRRLPALRRRALFRVLRDGRPRRGRAAPWPTSHGDEAALFCNWLSGQERLDPFYVEEFGKVVGFDPRRPRVPPADRGRVGLDRPSRGGRGPPAAFPLGREPAAPRPGTATTPTARPPTLSAASSSATTTTTS